MPDIIAIELIANLNEQTVEIVFRSSDRSYMTARLNRGGILDLEEQIVELLQKCPEIRGWKSTPLH